MQFIICDRFIFASHAGPTMKIERNIGDTSTARELGIMDLSPDTTMKFVDGWREIDAGWASAGVWVVQDPNEQKIKRS